MRLQHAAASAAAEWISGWSFEELVTFGGGSGFEAYARLRYLPDPTWGGQREAQVELPPDHLSDLDQARSALDHLARHTATADHCYFCIWDGYGSLSLDAVPGKPLVLDLPDRSYTLMEGPLAALRTWETDLGQEMPLVPPAIIWPADRSWCFVSDVDPHWAGIGASAEAVSQLLDDPTLDVVAADPSQPQPYYD
jgi:hypothetical protein